MKHSELQKQLDKKKWYVSQEAKRDMSGYMEYCEQCPFRKIESSFIPTPHTYVVGCCKNQELRERLTLCAKAYRKIHRVKVKEGN